MFLLASFLLGYYVGVYRVELFNGLVALYRFLAK